MGPPNSKPYLLISALLLTIHLPTTTPAPSPTTRPPGGPLHPFCLTQFALANHACASITYGPVSTANESRSAVFGHGGMQRKSTRRHRRKFRRRHRHRHHREAESEAGEECCKWMHAIEDFCICDMLVKLPSFLSRPIHRLVVVIDEDCKVGYDCPGRVLTVP